MTVTESTRESHQLKAADGVEIHVQVFAPAIVRGAIQVFHGLGEYAGRYARFAAAANERGYAVVVHDHRGHGGHDPENAGYFGAKNGWQLLVSDGLAVHDFLKQRWPDLPVCLLGHSMGSFVAQSFAMHYGARIDALILSSSTWPSRFEALLGNIVARIECWRVGAHRNSRLLDKFGFGDFNRRFEPGRTDHDWLSRDEAEVDAYVADPLCGGPYTAGLWRDLTGGLYEIASDLQLARIPGDLPILISGGHDDPLGGEKGMGKLALHYAQTSHGRLKVKLYPGGRHEMLNETNRDEVTDDWLSWIVASTNTG